MAPCCDKRRIIHACIVVYVNWTITAIIVDAIIRIADSGWTPGKKAVGLRLYIYIISVNVYFYVKMTVSLGQENRRMYIPPAQSHSLNQNTHTHTHTHTHTYKRRRSFCVSPMNESEVSIGSILASNQSKFSSFWWLFWSTTVLLPLWKVVTYIVLFNVGRSSLCSTCAMCWYAVTCRTIINLHVQFVNAKLTRLWHVKSHVTDNTTTTTNNDNNSLNKPKYW